MVKHLMVLMDVGYTLLPLSSTRETPHSFKFWWWLSAYAFAGMIVCALISSLETIISEM